MDGRACTALALALVLALWCAPAARASESGSYDCEALYSQTSACYDECTDCRARCSTRGGVDTFSCSSSSPSSSDCSCGDDNEAAATLLGMSLFAGICLVYVLPCVICCICIAVIVYFAARSGSSRTTVVHAAPPYPGSYPAHVNVSGSSPPPPQV